MKSPHAAIEDRNAISDITDHDKAKQIAVKDGPAVHALLDFVQAAFIIH